VSHGDAAFLSRRDFSATLRFEPAPRRRIKRCWQIGGRSCFPNTGSRQFVRLKTYRGRDVVSAQGRHRHVRKALELPPDHCPWSLRFGPENSGFGPFLPRSASGIGRAVRIGDRTTLFIGRVCESERRHRDRAPDIRPNQAVPPFCLPASRLVISSRHREATTAGEKRPSMYCCPARTRLMALKGSRNAKWIDSAISS
jgi:hypothetical protein